MRSDKHNKKNKRSHSNDIFINDYDVNTTIKKNSIDSDREDFLAIFDDIPSEDDKLERSKRKKEKKSGVIRKEKKKKAPKEQQYRDPGFGYSDKVLEKAKKKEKKKYYTDKNGKKRKKRKITKIIMYFLIVLLLLTLGVGIVGYLFLNKTLSTFDNIKTTEKDFNIDPVVAKNLEDYENIAVIGIDARKNEDHALARADVLMVMSINKKTKEMKMLSVMRDTYMYMNNRDGKNFFDKATHSHFWAGPVSTVRMLNENLDLNIDKFLVFNWQSVADTVDTIGGIEVEIKPNEVYDMNEFGPQSADNTDGKWINVKAGKQKLNGAQALTYCRIRETSGGDPARTSRNRIVIEAIIKELKSHPFKINDLSKNVFPKISTNLKTMDIIKLLPTGLRLKIGESKLYPYSFYGGLIEGAWVAVPTPLDDNLEKLHKNMFDINNYKMSDTVKKINIKLQNKAGHLRANDSNEKSDSN
ncbi:MAG: LCP family protein [Eubacteriales bacterium]|nr:LCP family protein [Eubacteriales bacterium]MDY3332928.1 LCP family protein [Gallibacter sp.]